jgi:hypothetical protein
VAFPKNIRLGYEGLQGTNTVAYSLQELGTKFKKMFYRIGLWQTHVADSGL